MRRTLLSLGLVAACILLVQSSAAAQTPDASTPAEEEACTKYEGEGARQGLCIAYCEAQDCDATKESNPSCKAIAERFIAYSVRQGYVKSPKEKPAISCQVTACSADDVAYCAGHEIDCNTGDGVCEQICTATFAGLDGDGGALCKKAPECKQCVGDDPTK